MELDSAIQEALIALLCYDNTKRGSALVQALVPTVSYDPYFKEIAEAAIRYYNEFKEAPGEHTADLVEQLKVHNGKKAANYDRLFRSLQATKDTVNREYVLKRATEFRRYQRCRGLIESGLEVLNNEKPGCVDECEAILGKASRPIDGVNVFDSGLTLNDPRQALQFLTEDQIDTFSTGIKQLDVSRFGPARGQDHLFFAPSNRGKTWWAVSCGKHALLDRARVLHITLEMSRQKIAQRYIQAFFSMTRREATKVVAQYFDRDKMGQFTGLEEVTFKNRPSLEDEGVREKLSKKIRSVLGHRSRLIIQHFPSGQATLNHIIAFMDNLERIEKFIPDMLILDYPELMKIDPKNYRIEIGQIHVGLRGVAQDRNLALVNLSQSNRGGYNVKRLQEKHMAEDMTKFNTADVVMSYNQTDAELELGLARLHLLKVREEAKNDMILISQAYGIGQFCVDSVRMSGQRYWDTLGSMDEEQQEDE